MTVWDLFNNNIPLWFATPAFVIIAAGFCFRGTGFFRFGFGKTPAIPSNVATKSDIKGLETRMLGVENRMIGVETRMINVESRMDVIEKDLSRIETNHFVHLNNFLELFCGILHDKGIITHEQSSSLKLALKG
jgi:hypothetical protein